MTRSFDLMLTGFAPAIWGSSYIVATQFLPGEDPMTVALLRALPAGLLLLLLLRQLPPLRLVPKLLLLGSLNFSLFWSLLFLAAYRLPGGVAATMGALAPLFVIALSRLWLHSRIKGQSLAAAGLGALGVAMMVLTPEAGLDSLGLLAGAAGMLSMAAGTVLSRKWQGDIPPLTYTAWQLTAGGLVLVPMALIAGAKPPTLSADSLFGFAYLGLLGGAVTYGLWFRGLRRLAPTEVALLGVLGPLTAMFLGLVFAGEVLGPLQALGAALAVTSLWLAQVQLHRLPGWIRRSLRA